MSTRVIEKQEEGLAMHLICFCFKVLSMYIIRASTCLMSDGLFFFFIFIGDNSRFPEKNVNQFNQIYLLLCKIDAAA